MEGFFVTFEGGDGAGKTTQIERAKSWFEERGRSVVTLREPGGCPLGERVRPLLLDPVFDHDPFTELLLFSAARRSLVETVIFPALADGKVVLCDRFADSTVAYQGYGRGIDRLFIDSLNKRVCSDAWPHLTLLLDLPVTVGRERAGRRGVGDRFEREEEAFHQRVRDGFLAIAAADPDRMVIVNAALDEASVAAEVTRRLTERVSS